MRIAIIGGTFNPVHYGHLRIAEEVREIIDLEKVLFIPACYPPHKDDASLISPEHRINMLRLAIEDNPYFELNDMEIRRGGKSYSIDTLRELMEEGHDTKIHFILGADSFNEITTWHEWRELFKLSSFVIVPRYGYPTKKITDLLPETLARRFRHNRAKGFYSNEFGHFVIYLETTLMNISASDIRRRVKEGRSLRYLLPLNVIDYIDARGLYR